ncbi:MAG: PH domain-containing protein [Bacteroidales bacterium]|nr:PH domain-containing protein [Clostridium sp.]MCM1204522.1 PH domain-containing protein [Bacteroidales bacterium]
MIDLKELIKNTGETVLWEGRPKKSVTVLEAIFNPMLLFALVWGGIDFSIIGGVLLSGEMQREGLLALLGFMLIHLMPVWMYLFGVLGVFFRWKNTRFLVTDRGLYVSGGLFSFNYEMKPWTDIAHVSIHQGVFDRMFGVGDVVSTCSHVSTQVHSGNRSSHDHGLKIYNIPDFLKVFQMVNDLQRDIFADTMYPNDLRPDTNSGYQTQYRGKF